MSSMVKVLLSLVKLISDSKSVVFMLTLSPMSRSLRVGEAGQFITCCTRSSYLNMSSGTKRIIEYANIHHIKIHCCGPGVGCECRCDDDKNLFHKISCGASGWKRCQELTLSSPKFQTSRAACERSSQVILRPLRLMYPRLARAFTAGHDDRLIFPSSEPLVYLR